MGDRSASLLRRFGLLVVTLAVAGLVLAFWADLTDESGGYRDATREVGGALVSGAVLAGTVVWFEDRRENYRVVRENERENRRFEVEKRRADHRQSLDEKRSDANAYRAWYRELEFRLLTYVYGDLWRGRMAVIPHRRSNPLTTHTDAGRDYSFSRGEVKHLLKTLNSQDLVRSWYRYEVVLHSDPIKHESSEGPLERDVRVSWVVRWLEAEEQAYLDFRDEVDRHVVDKYRASIICDDD